ncbi:MAG: transposase [Bacteroidaceae bacterium]
MAESPRRRCKAATNGKKARRRKTKRNQVEGKFGQGKAGYDLNKIKARLAETHESWVASIVFVMNILRAMEDIFCQIFKERLFQLIFQRKLHGKLSPLYYFVKVA